MATPKPHQNIAVGEAADTPAKSYEDRLARGRREAADRERERLAALDASHGDVWRAGGFSANGQAAPPAVEVVNIFCAGGNIATANGNVAVSEMAPAVPEPSENGRTQTRNGT